MFHSLNARLKWLLAVLFPLIVSACVFFAVPRQVVAVSLVECERACAQQNTSPQHPGAETGHHLAVDDQPEDEELGDAALASVLFGPCGPLRTQEPRCLAPRPTPQTPARAPAPDLTVELTGLVRAVWSVRPGAESIIDLRA